MYFNLKREGQTEQLNPNVLVLVAKSCTLAFKSFRDFLKEINTLIQQEHTELTKSNSKTIYNATKIINLI